MNRYWLVQPVAANESNRLCVSLFPISAATLNFKLWQAAVMNGTILIKWVGVIVEINFKRLI